MLAKSRPGKLALYIMPAFRVEILKEHRNMLFCEEGQTVLDSNMTRFQSSYLPKQCHLTFILAPDWPKEAILVFGRVSYELVNSIKLCH